MYSFSSFEVDIIRFFFLVVKRFFRGFFGFSLKILGGLGAYSLGHKTAVHCSQETSSGVSSVVITISPP